MADIGSVYRRVSERTKDCLKGCPHDEAGTTDCWFCRVNVSMKDKFIATKTNEPIDRRILHLQQSLGLMPEEPLSFANINRLIPPMVSRYSANFHNQVKPGKPFPSLQGRNKENDLHRRVQRLDVPAAPKDFNKESKPTCFSDSHTRNSAFTESQKNYVIAPEKRNNALHQRQSSNPYPENKGSQQSAHVASKGSNVAHQRHSTNPKATIKRSNKCATVIGDIPKFTIPEKSTISRNLITIPFSKPSTAYENAKGIPISPITSPVKYSNVPSSDHFKTSGNHPNNNKCATTSKFSVNISIELSKVSLPQLYSNPHVVKMRHKSPSTVLLKDSNLTSSSNNKLANTVLEKTTTANENHIMLAHKRHHSDHLLKKETKNILSVSKTCSKVVRRHSSDSSSAKEKLERGTSVSGKCSTVSPSESTKSEVTKKIPATSAIFTANPPNVPNLERFSTSQPLKIGTAQCRNHHDKYENIRKFSSKDLAGISVPELFANPHLVKRVTKLTTTVPNGRSTNLPNSRTSSHQHTKTGHTFSATVPHSGLCRSSKPLSVQPLVSAPSKGVKRHLSNAEYPSTKKILRKKNVS